VTPRLRVLTGIPKAERWPELRAPAVEHVLGLARRLARFTVLDCGFSLEDDEELSFDEVPDALTAMSQRETIGRVVVTI